VDSVLRETFRKRLPPFPLSSLPISPAGTTARRPPVTISTAPPLAYSGRPPTHPWKDLLSVASSPLSQSHPFLRVDVFFFMIIRPSVLIRTPTLCGIGTSGLGGVVKLRWKRSPLSPKRCRSPLLLKFPLSPTFPFLQSRGATVLGPSTSNFRLPQMGPRPPLDRGYRKLAPFWFARCPLAFLRCP